jgi:4-carboxymuconolactone decarboxylase
MKLVIAAAALVLAAASAQAGDRFPPLAPEQMTPEQKAVFDAIMTGPRKSAQGPFNAWLRSPELADRLQKVGEFVRFKTSLPHRLNEFAILITARYWTSQFEWYAHHPLALKEGMDPKVLADLAAGRRPHGMTKEEAALYDFCTELHRSKRVKDATYQAAVAAFGEQGVIDLIGVSGYYDVVSMTLNVAEVPLPPGEKRPLKPLKQ